MGEPRHTGHLLFSNGLSVPDTAALIESVKILAKSNKQVKKLWKNADYLKENLIKSGFDCGNSETTIIPIMLGNEELARNFSQKLFDNGIYATAIKFPMIALGKARIRIVLSAIHIANDLNFAISTFKKVKNILSC